ncbi:hypothetical protein Golax_016348, partial [Gossypium laxum]|nr:hypothetical protein [Gossypium laxum]
MVYMNGIASFIEYAIENCTNSYTYIVRARSALIKFSVSKLGGIDSTLLPSEDVRRTTDEVINLMDDCE